MKYIPSERIASYGEIPVVELTERNLITLLNKLKVDGSKRTLVDPEDLIAVRAVSDSDHGDDELLIAVRAVPDHAHYLNREPGPVLHGPED